MEKTVFKNVAYNAQVEVYKVIDKEAMTINGNTIPAKTQLKGEIVNQYGKDETITITLKDCELKAGFLNGKIKGQIIEIPELVKGEIYNKETKKTIYYYNANAKFLENLAAK